MKKALVIWFFVAALVAMGCSPPPDSFGSVGTLDDSWIEIWDWYDLDAIRSNLSGSYVLMTDLDSTSPGYGQLGGPAANGGKGWQPIGIAYDGFSGTFNGQGHEIRNLWVNRPDESSVGLFGTFHNGGRIENTGVVDVAVVGSLFVGGLVGGAGTVYATGTIDNCYSTGSVNGAKWVGGLVGIGIGDVSNSHSTASVAGEMYYAGGLVGLQHEGTISKSYASGDVVGCYSCSGGLVGYISYGTIRESYATGTVSGQAFVGGLAGVVVEYAAVMDSYATGNVTGDKHVGGLVGWLINSYLDRCYSNGDVSGSTWIGGLVGLMGINAATNDCFWDVGTSGRGASDGGTGKTTIQMKDIRTFSDPLWSDGLHTQWDITGVADETQRDTDSIWNIVDTQTYPFLSWEAVAGVQTQCVESTTGTGEVCFTTSHGFIEDLQAVPPHSLPSVLFPHGMFSFRITDLTPGQTVTLTIEFPSPLPIGTLWWKYDNGRWYGLPNESDNGDNIMVISLTDGGVHDLDDVPGQITDPGGPGNPMTVGWEGSPINKTAVMVPWVGLLAAIAGASLLLLRRRRVLS